MAKIIRSPSLSSETNSGKLNSKNYPFYNDTLLNATVPLWFVDCGREEAEKLLKSKHANYNVVLMRPSTKAGCMALSVQTIIAGNAEFNHYSVVKTTQGFIIDIDKKHRPMKTLAEVMDQFVKMASTTSRKYTLFEALVGKPNLTRSLRETPSHRKDPHLTGLPLPPTPGPPPVPQRPPVYASKQLSSPSNASPDGYVPIMPEDDDSECGKPAAIADNREDYLTLQEDDSSPRQRSAAAVVASDYLTIHPDTPATEQLQGLRIDDTEHYLPVFPDDEKDVNPTAAQDLNNNKLKPHSTTKQGPPPTAPRPTARC